MLICYNAAVFMLAFTNWSLSLAIGRTMFKILRLIGSGGLSRTTVSFLDGLALHVKIRAIRGSFG